MHRNNKTAAFSVAELLVVLSIFSLVVTLGIPAIKEALARWEVSAAVRTVYAGLSTARYEAVKQNNSIKCTCDGKHQLVLMVKSNTRWKYYKGFAVPQAVTLSTNASPVFSPLGFASPLCTFTIAGNYCRYRITIAITGRVKVDRVY